MAQKTPLYIQQAFKETVEGHFQAALLHPDASRDNFRKIREASLSALYALESAPSQSERDIIFEKLKESRTEFGQYVHGIVSKTNDLMWRKGTSVHTRADDSPYPNLTARRTQRPESESESPYPNGKTPHHGDAFDEIDAKRKKPDSSDPFDVGLSRTTQKTDPFEQNEERGQNRDKGRGLEL